MPRSTYTTTMLVLRPSGINILDANLINLSTTRRSAICRKKRTKDPVRTFDKWLRNGFVIPRAWTYLLNTFNLFLPHMLQLSKANVSKVIYWRKWILGCWEFMSMYRLKKEVSSIIIGLIIFIFCLVMSILIITSLRFVIHIL